MMEDNRTRPSNQHEHSSNELTETEAASIGPAQLSSMSFVCISGCAN